MKGKIVLITGATSGIGKAAAVSLAQSGASLILLGRNEKKGNKICQQIIGKTGNDKIKFYKADFLLLREVKIVADKVCNSYDKLDVLINNAGGRFLDHKVSGEGIEQTLAVNHLSHFLLTNVLIEHLKNSPSARIVNVSSNTHRRGEGIIKNVISPSEYNGTQQYSDSKLANVLFTYMLAEHLKGTNVTVTAMDPGGVATNFARNNGIVNWLKHRIYYFKKGELLTPKQGAETIIYLASSMYVEGITAKYFYRKKEKLSSELSYDKELQKKLWDLSKKMIKELSD